MASTGSETPQQAPSAGGLRRELRFWETIALSIGIMAPTAAMALNGTAPAGLVGRAVPLAFIFATVGILLGTRPAPAAAGKAATRRMLRANFHPMTKPVAPPPGGRANGPPLAAFRWGAETQATWEYSAA
jgi:hypothetical protein